MKSSYAFTKPSCVASMALRLSMQRIPSIRGPVRLPDCP